MYTSKCNSIGRPRTKLILLDVQSYRHLLIVIAASYIAIKSKQARIIKN